MPPAAILPLPPHVIFSSKLNDVASATTEYLSHRAGFIHAIFKVYNGTIFAVNNLTSPLKQIN